MSFYYGFIKPYMAHPVVGVCRLCKNGAQIAANVVIIDVLAKGCLGEEFSLLQGKGVSRFGLLTGVGCLGVAAIADYIKVFAMKKVCSGPRAGNGETYCHCKTPLG